MLKSLKMLNSHNLYQKDELWIKYLYNTKQKSVNLKNIKNLSDANNHFVFDYVKKTLELLDSEATNYNNYIVKLVEETLKWCEVAKCGNLSSRKKWMKLGLDLNIHNEASCEIYRDLSKNLII